MCTQDARVFLELCTDAWGSVSHDRRGLSECGDGGGGGGGSASLTTRRPDESFWTSGGFGARAARELVLLLGSLSVDEVEAMLTTFSSHILDAVRHHGLGEFMHVQMCSFWQYLGLPHLDIVQSFTLFIDVYPLLTRICAALNRTHCLSSSRQH